MTVISLVEHPELDWIGRSNYLVAKNHIRQTELYIGDLIWSIAKRNLQGDVPMPSEIANGKNKIDRRSGKEIVSDLLDKLGGE